MRASALLAACLAFAAQGADAYCIHNQLKIRDVLVEQEGHPDGLRDSRRLRVTLKPGERRCCAFHNLDCNPGGRQNSTTGIAVTILGEPLYECGYPAGAEPSVTVTGGATVRVLEHARYPEASSVPFILRIRTHDRQDLTGPRGLACPAAKPKGK